MLTYISEIAQFMLAALAKTWPYLLVTIPLAVAVNLSGASRYIRRAFQFQPIAAILLATLVGAFSPFCSCSVIPLVASLLIGGVPLAPVMSFWIASPSMDPEIFFLSAAMLGWELAAWRMGATLVLSLSAGLITHFLVRRGWLGENILRAYRPPRVVRLRDIWQWIRQGRLPLSRAFVPAQPAQAAAGFVLPQPGASLEIPLSASRPVNANVAACSSSGCSQGSRQSLPARLLPAPARSFIQQLFQETGKAAVLVLQFMTLAYFLEAVIQLYVPEAWIAGLLGHGNEYSIFTAALLGVPVYTSNLTALPLIGGLLAQGMNPAAALAFLIAGPTTTLPAMTAVWGLVSRRVFALYLAFSLFGAILLGYAYQFVASL